MKKIFAIALAAVMACGIFAGCGERKDNGGQESTPAGGSSASGSAVEAIKANGKLVMYTNAAFPPFEYQMCIRDREKGLVALASG